ncbi:oxidoreductase-like domain-containing protein [Dokdonella sp.]|uniref:oxidoreductase-like domain-containing protein n=1 Tax=Dokdonella sp. TaxID=2291710 RepID=UPI003528BD64
MTTHDLPEPQRPVEPDPLDCCGSGCVRCVFDLYDDAMQRYREELAAWEESRRGGNSGNA